MAAHAFQLLIPTGRIIQASFNTLKTCRKVVQIGDAAVQIIVITDINLSQIFHIMYIQSHHVAQSVREE